MFAPEVFQILVNDPQGKVFFLGVVFFFVAPVEARVWFGLNILCSGFFLVYEIFQMHIPNKLVKKNLQSSVILDFMSFLLVIGTFSSLIELFGVPSQRVGLLEVRFILDSGKELVDQFPKNHIDPLPYSVLVIS